MNTKSEWHSASNPHLEADPPLLEGFAERTSDFATRLLEHGALVNLHADALVISIHSWFLAHREAGVDSFDAKVNRSRHQTRIDAAWLLSNRRLFNATYKVDHENHSPNAQDDQDGSRLSGGLGDQSQ